MAGTINLLFYLKEGQFTVAQTVAAVCYESAGED